MNARRSVSLGSLLPDWLAGLPLMPSTAKELRPLLPVALGTVLLGLLTLLMIAVAIAVPSSDSGVLVYLPALGYAVGLVTLGATAFGHEYVHRTVDLLLTQPVPRRQLLESKLRVLLPLLAVSALPGVGMTLLSPEGGLMALVLAPLLSSVLVAPWITLICRSTLAGVVFTVTLPYLIWMLVSLATEFVWPAIDAVGLAWFAGLLVAHWVLGGVLGWQKFMRLEAVESGQAALRLPWLRSRVRRDRVPTSAAGAAPDSPLRRALTREIRVVRPATWMLVKKELRLQPAAGWVAAVFTVSWLAQAWLISSHGLAGQEFLVLVSGFYMLFMPLLLGSVACAEERSLGTLAWHLTLPFGAGRQWVIKSAVTLALALLLGLVLPWVLASVFPLGVPALDDRGLLAVWGGTIAGMTFLGLYASSASQQSVLALLFGLTLAIGIPPVLTGISILSFVGVFTALTDRPDLAGQTAGVGQGAILLGALPPLALLLFWLGGRNFRTPSVSPAARVGQLVAITLAVLLTGVLAGTAAALADYRTYLRAQAAGEVAATEAGVPAEGAAPDANLARRYGTTVLVPSTNGAAGSRIRIMKRYGLMPPNSLSPSTSQSARASNSPPAIPKPPTPADP